MADTDLIEVIRQAWGWTGIEPVTVIGDNEFGNLLIEDEMGQYWRLCPEECYCKVIASDKQALEALSADQEFLDDWYMRPLVDLARELCGPLSAGRKYGLRTPGVLGGQYGGDNLGTSTQAEIVRFSGAIAKQIKDLPDGAAIQFKHGS